MPRVLVIDEEGEQLGDMSTDDALTLAQERGFDLVEVAPAADPPHSICLYIFVYSCVFLLFFVIFVHL